MNIENIEATKEHLKDLIKDVEQPGCESKRIDELKEILEAIGNDATIYAKYEDIYDAAADALMLAGISAEECSCDPLRKHIPKDKEE